MATKKSKKRRRKFLVFAGILVVLLGAWAAMTMGKKESPLSVETEVVERRDITEVVSADGRIHPVAQVTISPEVSGEIINLPVREGQMVKKGDLLLEIRPDFYEAAMAQQTASHKSALAGLDSAKANLRRAQFEFSRIEKLFQDDLESASNHQTAKTAMEVRRRNTSPQRIKCRCLRRLWTERRRIWRRRRFTRRWTARLRS